MCVLWNGTLIIQVRISSVAISVQGCTEIGARLKGCFLMCFEQDARFAKQAFWGYLAVLKWRILRESELLDSKGVC